MKLRLVLLLTVWCFLDLNSGQKFGPFNGQQDCNKVRTEWLSYGKQFVGGRAASSCYENFASDESHT